MRSELLNGIENQVNAIEYELIKNSTLHLGVFTEPCLSYMLEGRKTIESRFSKKKILPWKNISLDDIVFIKKSGGKVVGYFKIKEIQFIDLELVSIEELKVKYSDYLCVDDTFWEVKKDSKYATLIFIKEIVRLNPFCVNKKGMNTWIKLKED